MLITKWTITCFAFKWFYREWFS